VILLYYQFRIRTTTILPTQPNHHSNQQRLAVEHQASLHFTSMDHLLLSTYHYSISLFHFLSLQCQNHIPPPPLLLLPLPTMKLLNQTKMLMYRRTVHVSLGAWPSPTGDSTGDWVSLMTPPLGMIIGPVWPLSSAFGSSVSKFSFSFQFNLFLLHSKLCSVRNFVHNSI
jgi:hypothetical protein